MKAEGEEKKGKEAVDAGRGKLMNSTHKHGKTIHQRQLFSK